MIQHWEFGGLPAEWVGPMRDAVDEIWVASTWVRDCFIRSGVPGDKVVVIPAGLDLDVLKPDGPKYHLRTRKRFKFLFVGGTIGRKGIDILVETYLRTFSAADDVCLIIKAAAAGGAYAQSSIESEISRLSAMPGAPEIEYVSASLTDAQIAALYRASDALVHPYRGEGFGMPIAEAMACGLPAIVTGYGAALDFCDEQTAFLIPAREVPLLPGSHALPAESIGYWLAEPDRAALAVLMRRVVADPAAARAVGERARVNIQRYNWRAVSDQVLERLKVLATRAPVRYAVPAPLHLDGRRSVAYPYRPTWSGEHWQSVIAAYASTFTSADDVTLVVCVDPEQGVTEGDAVQRVNSAMRAHGIDPEGAADLLLVPDRLDERTLERLYAAVDWVVPSEAPREREMAGRAGAAMLASLDSTSWRAAARTAPVMPAAIASSIP